MSLRAIIVGFICVIGLCWFCFFNDFVMKQSFLVGNYMPISVFGGLILFLLTINPLLGWLGKGSSRRFAFSGKELAVVIAIVLAGCAVPGRGLMHYFATFLMLPHHYERTNTSWQQTGVVEMAPKEMLADVSKNSDKALDGFVQGMSVGNKHIRYKDIPWEAWTRTLAFWVPLILSISIALIGLALVVHRQWSEHEQIPYPIVNFAKALLPQDGDSQGSVFKNRLFQMSASFVLVFHMNNYATTWWPLKLIPIPRQLDFSPLTVFFPTILRGDPGLSVFMPYLFFTVIGFAYFLASDVSLALGIAPTLYSLFLGICLTYGVSVAGSGGFLSLSLEGFMYAGAYMAMFLVMMYTGRYYYSAVLRRGLFLPAREKVERREIYGMRVFFAGSAIFALLLVKVGLDWQLAIAYTTLTVILLTVVSRVVAETGAIFIHPWWFPCVLIMGVMGEKSLGPQTMLIMFMVTSLMVIDPREGIMTYMVHGLKLTSGVKVNLGKVATLGGAALVLAFAVAIPVTLYWEYDQGYGVVGDVWSTKSVPSFAFDSASSIKQRLEAQDGYQVASTVRGWSPLQGSFAQLALFACIRLHFPISYVVHGSPAANATLAGSSCSVPRDGDISEPGAGRFIPAWLADQGAGDEIRGRSVLSKAETHDDGLDRGRNACGSNHHDHRLLLL